MESKEELKQAFDRFYMEKLYGSFGELEGMRRKYLQRFWLLVALSFLIVPAIGFIVYVMQWDPAVFIFGTVLMIVIAQSPINSYRQYVKNGIMKDFTGFFKDFDYRFGNLVDAEKIRLSRLFGNYDRRYGDDYFEGKYKNVTMTISEEKLTQIVRTRKSRHEQTVFDGVIVILSMNKKFKGQTVVKKDYGWLGNKFTRPSGLQRLRLEDPVFERKFEVYSDNQIEARYLLTTAFMERLLRLKQAFGGKKIECSFFDHQLMIVISTSENMFETSSFFHSAFDKKRMDRAFEQFCSVREIVDILKLNQQLGM